MREEEEIATGSKAFMAKDLYGFFSVFWGHEDKKHRDSPCLKTVIHRLVSHFGNRLSSVTPSKKLGLLFIRQRSQKFLLVLHDQY